MTTRVTSAGSGVVSVERDGEVFTGLGSGIPANSFTIRRLTSKRREDGWVYRDEKLSPWPQGGLVEHSGLVYVIGPPAPGVFLEDSLTDPDRDHLADLLTITKALEALSVADEKLAALHTRSVLLLDAGGVLVLPPEISQSIVEHLDIPRKLRTFEPYAHPDKKPDDNVGFFLAALAYRILTGALAYDGASTEEIHARVRDASPVTARHRRFTLSPEISEFLNATLSGTSYEPSAAVWAEKLALWNDQGVDLELSEEEREQVRLEAESDIAKNDRTFGRREKVRRNWRRWAMIAAIVVAVGIIPGTIVRNALQPRATAGLSPDEVVMTYYTSVNTLSHMVMEDAVVDRAGRDLIREVISVYVIDRQRMSVEMRSGFVDAQQWRDAGAPELEADVKPYGVVDVVLEPLPSNPGEKAYRATYERWVLQQTESSDGLPTAATYQGLLITDELKLRQDREDWVIYELVTLSIEELDLAELRREAARQLTGSAAD